MSAEPIPLHPPKPEPFTKYGLGWRYEVPNQGIILSVDYLKRRSDELHGVLTIESTRPGESGHLHEATQNFSGLSARSALAKHLSTRAPDVDWPGILETFCVGVMRRASKGEPYSKLMPPTGRQAKPEWLVEDIFPLDAISWWYGARASCKSQTMAFLTTCLGAGLPFLEKLTKTAKVGILDYEDRKATWENYLALIATAYGCDWPDIHYKHCSVPLVKQLNAIARENDGEGIDVLIIDSFGMAAGPTSEHGGFEESVLNFCAAIKELNLTTIVIDHISQASRMNPTLPADPAGSQQKLAQARAGYELRMEKDPGSPVGHIGIFDRKHQMNKPIGVKATWGEDSLTFEVENMLETNTEMAQMSLKIADRILFQLQRGAMDAKQLSERLGVGAGQVRMALSRMRQDDKVMKLPDDTWGLSARQVYGEASL